MDIGGRRRESLSVGELPRSWLGFMRRISAIFIAVCMVLIAGSLGVVLYLGFQVDAPHLGARGAGRAHGLALYNTVSNRLRDRRDVGDQIADLSRGTADLARQVAEQGRRLGAMENKVEAVLDRARGTVDPLAAEIGELGAPGHAARRHGREPRHRVAATGRFAGAGRAGRRVRAPKPPAR